MPKSTPPADKLARRQADAADFPALTDDFGRLVRGAAALEGLPVRDWIKRALQLQAEFDVQHHADKASLIA